MPATRLISSWIWRTSLVLSLVVVPVQCCRAQAKAGDATKLPADKAVDLLAMVKLPEHNLRGTWKRQDGAIVCEPSAGAEFMVPVAILGSYELNCEFTRRTHDDDVGLILPVGVTSVALLLSGWHGGASGLNLVGGREAISVPITSGAVVRPGKLNNGQRYHLHVEVTQTADRAAIKAALDGKRFINWVGPVSQLSVTPHGATPCPMAVGVWVHNSIADIHKLELTLQKGSQGYRLGDDGQNPLSAVADKPPKNIAGQCLTWKDKDDRKYFISDKPMSRSDAQRLAAQLKGRLLTISSREEEDFIMKEGRGVGLWMSGWRTAGSNIWRDERHRPLRYTGRWWPGQPSRTYWEIYLCVNTTEKDFRGWDDGGPDARLHACIEWGEEYPETD